MNKEYRSNLLEQMYKVFSLVGSSQDFAKLFADLCTDSELDQMAQRMESAKLVLQGETYSQVMAQTDISSATLSRISRCIKYGSGGYAEILKGIIDKNDI